MAKRESMLAPTIVLTGICVVVVALLALTYQMTNPIIIQRTLEAAETTRIQVLPEGDTFQEITGATLPEGVADAYKSDNGAGYVFTTQAKGYDGLVTVMVGISSEGKVTGINMFDHNETPGMGSKVGKAGYLEPQYYGKGRQEALKSDGIAGATRTSNAMRNAVSLAFDMFEILEGEG